MGPKSAIGAIALMLLGVGIPSFFKVSWGWGGVLCFVGVVLLVVSCSAWAFGRKSPGLELDLRAPGVPRIPKNDGDVASDPLTVDKETLKNLQAIFPSSVIADLRTQQFWTTFTWKTEIDNALQGFYQWGLLPEHRFLYDGLEKVHASLRDLAHTLYDRVHRYTEILTLTNKEGRGFIPINSVGNPAEQAERESHRNEIWETKDKICDTYEQLIRTAKQHFLGVAQTPKPSMELTIEDVRFYNSTVMRDGERYRQKVFITVIVSIANQGKEASVNIGSLWITHLTEKIDCDLISTSGRWIPDWIKKEWESIAGIEEVTRNMVVSSGHAITRFCRFQSELDNASVPAIQQHGIFTLSVVDSSGVRFEGSYTAQPSMRQH